MTEKTALYPTECQELSSVTEVLGAFPSIQLLNWYRKMAFADQKAVSDKGKEIGSTLHDLRVKIENGGPFEILTKYPQELQNCIKAYFKWKKERDIPPVLYTELKMYSRVLGYKGTLDDIYGNAARILLY